MGSSVKKRLLVYGGAFDPPHLGHERMLKTAIEQIEPDRVLVMPSQVSPHKRSSVTPFADRAAMCRTFQKLAPRVTVSEMENGKNRKESYTLKTIKRLRRRYPQHELVFLLGTDMLTTFHQWHRYRRLLSLCTLAAASRYRDDDAALLAAKARLEREGGRVVIVQLDELEMSSTDIRAAAAAGRPLDGLVSDTVAAYIEKHGLYRKEAAI